MHRRLWRHSTISVISHRTFLRLSQFELNHPSPRRLFGAARLPFCMLLWLLLLLPIAESFVIRFYFAGNSITQQQTTRARAIVINTTLLQLNECETSSMRYEAELSSSVGIHPVLFPATGSQPHNSLNQEFWTVSNPFFSVMQFPSWCPFPRHASHHFA